MKCPRERLQLTSAIIEDQTVPTCITKPLQRATSATTNRSRAFPKSTPSRPSHAEYLRGFPLVGAGDCINPSGAHFVLWVKSECKFDSYHGSGNLGKNSKITEQWILCSLDSNPLVGQHPHRVCPERMCFCIHIFYGTCIRLMTQNKKRSTHFAGLTWALRVRRRACPQRIDSRP